MFLGEYRHSFDEKKRISLPVKFRQETGRKIVVTRGLDNCLFIYPVREWARIAKKLGALPMGQADTRGFSRFMLSGAVELAVDSVGRVLIPDFLRSFASLNEKVVFAGVNDRVEIWDEERWNEYKSRIERQGDQFAEKLGEIGIL
ncbi:MAG: division/cell wall cluster transcriptional repressor MraZ [Candidatus Taylorbacteria bacterium]|nr:division/cell wall cluster transcriptional repressor MraZ [Candidatus Taylorbacteria bacterium]